MQYSTYSTSTVQYRLRSHEGWMLESKWMGDCGRLWAGCGMECLNPTIRYVSGTDWLGKKTLGLGQP